MYNVNNSWAKNRSIHCWWTIWVNRIEHNELHLWFNIFWYYLDYSIFYINSKSRTIEWECWHYFVFWYKNASYVQTYVPVMLKYAWEKNQTIMYWRLFWVWFYWRWIYSWISTLNMKYITIESLFHNLIALSSIYAKKIELDLISQILIDTPIDILLVIISTNA